jgi:hypothetical protein
MVDNELVYHKGRRLRDPSKWIPVSSIDGPCEYDNRYLNLIDNHILKLELML